MIQFIQLGESGKIWIDNLCLKERVSGGSRLFVSENGSIFAVFVRIFGQISIHICLGVHVGIFAWIFHEISMGVSLLIIINDGALKETTSVVERCLYEWSL